MVSQNFNSTQWAAHLAKQAETQRRVTQTTQSRIAHNAKTALARTQSNTKETK